MVKTEKTNSRIAYIDIARAFACFLMVWGHVAINYEKGSYHAPVAVWIYSFHMALFMMLSGMFLSSSFF